MDIMDFKGTQGVWEAHEDLQGRDMHKIYSRGAGYASHSIGYCTGYENAKLMAASQHLLSALMYVVELHDNNNKDDRKTERSIIAARAAINIALKGDNYDDSGGDIKW